MEIIKDLNPGIKKYRFTHYNCYEFTGQYNETTASVVCPKCKELFYDDPILIDYKK